ncbi:hypothetical protein U8527_09825 [Kordia algicida OT-1]|uniref:Uncharacterized protein n=1 Tax=Kordia algicida OT-1 TaxID=391587 RepID=A9DVB4_9FLAO|nr:hypothetical protein [Kordia algicida]EDP96399.1 hypothetical protein KAOT1_03282 [Kordia algicida OT-1]
MKTLQIQELELIEGGNDFVDGFCDGFSTVSGIYGLAFALGWVPAVGQTAAIVMGVVSVGCAIAT